MPPKGASNAFFFFMMDFKKREESRGRFFDDMSAVSAAAGEEWKEMSSEERHPYELKKQQHKKGKKDKKYTTLGEDISVLQRREQEEENERKLMMKNIEDLVASGNDYVSKYFFIADVNHYCYCNALDKHIPAEISIVRFSLKEGICLEDCYHVILDTGSMPIGYRLTAVTVSSETHQIPIPPHDDSIGNFSEKNIRKAYSSMTEFLRKNLGPREFLPPVYVDDTNMIKAKDIFKNLYQDYAGDNVYSKITVHSLSYLFYVLRNAAHSRVSPDKAFPAPTIPQAELEKDVYDYVKGIACEYHNTTDDAYPHCTLSKCIRKAFIICDHTCCDLDIPLEPGRHVPKNVKIEKLNQRPSSQVSWTTVSNNSRPSSSLSDVARSSVAGTTRPVQITTKKFAQLKVDEEEVGESVVKNEVPKWPSLPTGNLAYNTVAASRPNSVEPLRKPQSVSMARSFQPPPPADLNNDFPALGSSRPGSAARQPVAGRGRGRILQNMINK